MKCIAIRICPAYEVQAQNMVNHLSQMGGVLSASVTQEAADDGVWTGFYRVKVQFADGLADSILTYMYPEFRDAKVQDLDYANDTGYEWQDMTAECRKVAE